jgi:hypothetical protein
MLYDHRVSSAYLPVRILTLSADHLARLEKVSAPTLGFPHEFLRHPAITNVVYGDRWQAIEDRRTTARRTVNDVL